MYFYIWCEGVESFELGGCEVCQKASWCGIQGFEDWGSIGLGSCARGFSDAGLIMVITRWIAFDVV